MSTKFGNSVTRILPVEGREQNVLETIYEEKDYLVTRWTDLKTGQSYSLSNVPMNEEQVRIVRDYLSWWLGKRADEKTKE